MSSLTNLELLQGVLYLKTSNYPLNRKLYDILFQIDTYHRNELFVQELELLDSVLNIPIFILEVKPILTEEEQGSLDVWNDIDNWKGLCLEAQENIFEHIFNPDIILCFEEAKRNEEQERVMMGFEDYPAQCDEELDREKREFFELMYQRILFNLNLFIQDFINFNSQVDDVFDDFEEKELDYIKDNILVNLIKINLNIFDFLDRFELSNFFLFRKMILLQIKIVSYEEENIAVGKTQRGKIEMILDKKKINQEGLKLVMREIGKFISNGTLEVQGPDSGSLF